MWIHLLMLPLVAASVWGDQASPSSGRASIGGRPARKWLRPTRFLMPAGMLVMVLGVPGLHDLTIGLLVLAAGAALFSGHPRCSHCREMAASAGVMAMLVALPGAIGPAPALALLLAPVAAIIWSVRTTVLTPVVIDGQGHSASGPWLIGRVAAALASVCMVLALV